MHEVRGVVARAKGEPVGIETVLVPDPGYPIYESLTRFVGATSVPVPIRMAADFRLDVGELASRVTPRTRLLILNTPHNPTGAMMT